jgi:hypothetical protein
MLRSIGSGAARYHGVLTTIAVLSWSMAGCGDASVTYLGGGESGTRQLILEPTEVTVSATDSVELRAYGLSASGDTTTIQLSWSATGGTVRGKGKGNARGVYKGGKSGKHEVVATDTSGVADTAIVTVSEAVVASVEVEPPVWTLSVGSALRLVPIARDQNGEVLTGHQTSWSTTDAGVVRVDSDGLVTALAKGTAIVSATVSGQSGSSSITVETAPEGSCLAASSTVESGSPHVEYVFSSPGHAVNASAVVWSGSGQEETLVSFEGDYPACFSGGAHGAVLDGGMPVDAMYECTTEHCGGTCPTPCYSYHSAAGLGPDVGALQVIEDIQIRDTGDGVSLETDAARDAVVRRVYMHNIHDDAFESDFGLGGFTVEDVLVERAYTAFAMRLRGGASGDQRDRLWTIRDNLVRLYAFPNGYKQKAGHGNVFKLDESANEPRFRMTGNTIVVGPDPGSSTLFPPVSRVEECANNVYLFLGTQAAWEDALDSDGQDDGGNNGERLAALNQRFPGCFDVRVRSVGMSEAEFLVAEGWTAAVANWKASHVAGSIR